MSAVLAKLDSKLPQPAKLPTIGSAAEVLAQRRFVAAVRMAIKEYDQVVRPDGRVKNGGPRKSWATRMDALHLLRQGLSIRKVAQATRTSFGFVWKLKEQAKKDASAFPAARHATAPRLR
jgi:hypothetical protein